MGSETPLIANADDAAVDIAEGNGEFIETDLETGSDTDQHTDAQRVYQKILDQVASKRKKSNIGGAWRDAHNRWRRETGEQVSAVLHLSPMMPMRFASDTPALPSIAEELTNDPHRR